MRKLFVTLALMFAFVAISNAQIATLSIVEPDTYVEYSTNVTLTNTTAQYFIIKAPQDWYTAPCFIVQLDSLTGNNTSVAVNLSGRISDQTSTWTSIATVTWGCTTADTTIISLTGTETAYREYKLLFTPAGTGTVRIDNTEFKQYLGLP